MQLQMVTVPLDEMSLNADNHTYEAKHIWSLDTYSELCWLATEMKQQRS